MTSVRSVDIVIDNYNYARFLGQAIDSALGQTHPPEQVIVVDDGSTDESRDVIASYGDRVTPILKANGGQASALNEGFCRATSDLVIFLDADDMLLPDIVGRVIAAAQNNAGVAKIQYPMKVIDERGRLTAARKPPPHLSLPSGDLRRQELVMPFDMTWMSTSGNAFPRWVLEDILPIPEAKYPVCADYYLQHLTPLFGPVISLDDVGALYRVHGANSYEPSSDHLDLDHVRQTVLYALITRPEIERIANNLGLAHPREILSVADVANRLISKKLDPALHPVSTDTVTGLVSKGIKAASRRFDVAVPMKLGFGAWFVLMAAAPRPMARALAEGFTFPERRAALNRLLGSMHRRQPARQ
jgi:glycosyltransferase involved in cell wall biosynthesis